MACHHPGQSNCDLVPSINSPGMLVRCRGRIEGNASCNDFPSSLAFILLKELKWNCCGVECASRVVDVLSTAGEVHQFICLQWRKCYRANLSFGDCLALHPRAECFQLVVQYFQQLFWGKWYWNWTKLGENRNSAGFLQGAAFLGRKVGLLSCPWTTLAAFLSAL